MFTVYGTRPNMWRGLNLDSFNFMTFILKHRTTKLRFTRTRLWSMRDRLAHNEDQTLFLSILWFWRYSVNHHVNKQREGMRYNKIDSLIYINNGFTSIIMIPLGNSVFCYKANTHLVLYNWHELHIRFTKSFYFVFFCLRDNCDSLLTHLSRF